MATFQVNLVSRLPLIIRGIPVSFLQASSHPTLGYCNLTHLNRRDAVILRRLHVGHTRLTHQYLLRREEPPQCHSCNCALTVVHILLECQQCNSVRQKYFPVTAVKDLFDTVSSRDILSFLRDIRLYSCI